jgi:hypothetical protein
MIINFEKYILGDNWCGVAYRSFREGRVRGGEGKGRVVLA